MSIQLGDALALELNIDGNLTPASSFDAVPAIATSVPGLTAEMNAQAQALANRSEFLSDANGLYSYQGKNFWETIFSPPDANDIPSVTSSTSSQITTPNVLLPTSDFYYDPNFRYDGTYQEALIPITGGIRADSTNGQICPEIYTDAQDIEFKFNPGRTGTGAVHIRVLVDGKFCQLQMLRFNSTSGTPNYYRLQFPTQKARRIKIEQEGHSDFLGAYLATYSLATRPIYPYKHRHVVVGDSLQQGGAYTGDVPGSYFYCRWEAHSRFQAALYGADSYINLGQGGTGWSDVVPSNPYFERVQKAVNIKADSIGIYGSRNDTGRESQIIAAVSKCIEYCTSTPVVIVSGPQQAGYDELNSLVNQGVKKFNVFYLNLNGSAPSPSSNPTGHPTFAEQINIAKDAAKQTDIIYLKSLVDSYYFSKASPSVSSNTLPSGPVAAGSSILLNSQISFDMAGKVQFYINGSPYGSPVLISSKSASISYTAPDGSASVAAKFLPADPSVARESMSKSISITGNTNTGFTDNFDRPDGPMGSTANGKNWSTNYSGWQIVGNKAGRPSATSTGYTVVDSGLFNGVFTVTMKGVFDKNAGLVFRYFDGSNFLRLNWSGTGNQPKIDAVVSNVSYGAVTGTGGAWTDGDVIQITMNENAVSVKKNGIEIVSGNFSQSYGNSKAGFIGTSTSTGCYFDNVSFVSL